MLTVISDNHLTKTTRAHLAIEMLTDRMTHYLHLQLNGDCHIRNVHLKKLIIEYMVGNRV